MKTKILNLAFWFGIALQCYGESQSFLWQTNSQGDDIHIYNLEDFSLHHVLEVGPEPHGIAAASDGSVVYVTLEHNGEAQGELLWIDPKSLVVTHRLKVGPQPHAIATTPDGKWIYIPCRDEQYWVVDGVSKKVVAKINTGGRPHNTQVSSDGRFMFLSPMGSPKGVTVVDVHDDHKIVGFISYSASVRPSTLSTDGKWFFHHVDGLNGFEAAKIEDGEVFASVKHSTTLGWFRPIKKLGYMTFGGLKRCHGLGVTPDQSEIWSVCANNLSIHTFDQLNFPEERTVTLPSKGYWITFSSDNLYGFVALSDTDEVAVYDVKNKNLVQLLSVGNSPKRNIVISTDSIF